MPVTDCRSVGQPMGATWVAWGQRNTPPPQCVWAPLCMQKGPIFGQKALILHHGQGGRGTQLMLTRAISCKTGKFDTTLQHYSLFEPCHWHLYTPHLQGNQPNLPSPALGFHHVFDNFQLQTNAKPFHGQFMVCAGIQIDTISFK